MALTTGRNLKLRGDMRVHAAVIKTGITIYKHALVALDAAGVLTTCQNSTTQKGIGIAKDTYAVGDGTVVGEAFTDCDVFAPIAAAVTVALAINTKLYAADDETVTTSNTLGPEIGTLMNKPTELVPGQAAVSGFAWIRMRGLQTGVAS